MPRIHRDRGQGSGGFEERYSCHYAYQDVEQFSQTMDQYARLSAQHYFEQEHSRWRSNPMNEVLHPLWTLFTGRLCVVGC